VKTLETSLAAAKMLVQPCDDAVIIAVDDVSNDLASQIYHDVRLAAEFRTLSAPIYVQHLSFLC
jgi:hypothetical protein